MIHSEAIFQAVAPCCSPFGGGKQPIWAVFKDASSGGKLRCQAVASKWSHGFGTINGTLKECK